MSETRSEDPYSAVALLGDHDFELRTSEGLAVPLSFEPDAAFVMRSLLSHKSITPGNISREPGFRAVIPDGRGGSLSYETRVAQHSRLVFSRLVFTLNALRSTLIQIEYDGTVSVRGGARFTKSNIYHRNPAYAVLDERS